MFSKGIWDRGTLSPCHRERRCCLVPRNMDARRVVLRYHLKPSGQGSMVCRLRGTDSSREQGRADNTPGRRVLGPGPAAAMAAGEGGVMRTVAVTNAKGGVG